MAKTHHRKTSSASSSIVSAILRLKQHNKRHSLPACLGASTCSDGWSPCSSRPFYHSRAKTIQLPATMHEPHYPRPASSKKHQRASFLSLPAEIRLQIYALVFAPTPPHTDKTGARRPAASDCAYTRARLLMVQRARNLTAGADMLLVCRQLYHECLPLLRRTVRVAPRMMPLVPQDVSCFEEDESLSMVTAGAAMVAAPRSPRALPLDRTRLGKLDAAELERLRIREVVVSEVADNLPSTRDMSKLEQSGRIVRVPLQVETVYLQICTCGRPDPEQRSAVPGLPDYARLRTGQLAGAIYSVFLSIGKVARIVVYYCSVTKVCSQRGEVQQAAQVQAMQNVFAEVVMEKRDDGSDVWWAEPLRTPEYETEIDSVTRYRMTFPEYEGRPTGSVVVEFYDSYSQTGSKCVAVQD